MKFATGVFLVLVASATVDVSGATVQKKSRVVQKGTPVEGVITLLEKLEAQIKQEGKDEAASYDKFACFCKEQADEKFYIINKAKKKIELLEAEIETLDAEIDDLNAETAKAKKEKEGLDEEIEADKKARQEALEAFTKADGEKADLIDALKRAIAALEDAKEAQVNAKVNLAQEYTAPIVKHLMGAGNMLSLSQEQVQTLLGFLDAATPDGVFLQQDLGQNPHAYEYKSNDIIAVLKEMLKSITGEKQDAVTAEQNDKHESDMLVNGKENVVEGLDAQIAKNENILAAKEDLRSAKQQDEQQTTTDMGHDQEFLDDLTDQCEDKAKLFDQRSKTRMDELTAIAGALDELKGTVKGKYAANKKLVGLVDENHPRKDDEDDADDEDAEGVSFLQQRNPRGSARRKVLRLLRATAERLGSSPISTLVLKMKADHFVKVRGLIMDLVKKLEEEAKAEAEEKAFCDEELGKAIGKRDENQITIEKTNAEITKAGAHVDQLTEDIGGLATDIAELNKAKKEAQELRTKENEENTMTLEEAKEGLAAVKRAIGLLKEFYENAFLQNGYEPFRAEGAGADGKTVGDMAPDAGFDDEYHGNQEASKGIIGLLEVIQSDFERTIETVESEEEDAAKAHDDFVKETDGNIDEKEGIKGDKETEKKDTEATIVELNDEQADAKQMKKQALEELEKLRPTCIDTGLSWEERTKKREQEIEALKEALQILDTAFD